MMFLLGWELVACTGCRHHFVRPSARWTLHCIQCGNPMVRVAVNVDHRDIAGLPMAQPALEPREQVA